MSYNQCGLSAFNRFWKSLARRFLRCFLFIINNLQKIYTRNSSVWFYVVRLKICNWKRCWKRSNLLHFQYLRWTLFSLVSYVCVKFCFFKKYLNVQQGSTITIKSPYVITYICQDFGVRDVRRQIPKAIYRMSNLFPSDFSNSFFLSSFLFE